MVISLVSLAFGAAFPMTKERSFRGLLGTLAVVGLGVDQLTKYGIFRWLYNDGQGGDYVLIPGAFRILVQYSKDIAQGEGFLGKLRTWSGANMPRVNHGALFGMGQEYATWANLTFAGVSFLAAAAIVWWSLRPAAARDAVLCSALGLILAGTLGNLYDRLVFNGVRDFLYWSRWFEWPVFNIADFCLVCGVILLTLQALFHAKPETAPTPDLAHAAAGAEVK
jgi:signal peptidase II